MLRQRYIRELFEARCEEGRADRTGRSGRLQFVRDFWETCGVLMDDRGRPTYDNDERGQPRLLEGRCRPEEVSIRELADAIIGHDNVQEYFHPASGIPSNALLESAIDPTAFLNISTFNLAIAGLVDAQILERFKLAEYIGDQLCTVVQTRKNGDKLIGATRIGAYASEVKNRLPGQPHAEVGFGQNYQTTPETVEQALKCKVSREAVFFDLTGEVLDEAGGVGDELGYGREKDIINGVMGVTQSYTYNGTTYATYQTASPYVNDQSNQLTDWQSVNTVIQTFSQMTDPATGKEILVTPTQVLVAPYNRPLAEIVFNGGDVKEGTNLNSNFPARWTGAPNPIQRMAPQLPANILSSPIAFNRATAADGLNLSTANAKLYWWCGDFKKAFEWRENWPLTPWQASATEMVMKDQGLIAVFGANYRGILNVRQPRYVTRNKN